jgi:succinyl-CoA synthetase beta subunit
LHLHEYQSQGLMKEYGINVPAGSAAETPEEAQRIAEALGINPWTILILIMIKPLLIWQSKPKF